jgi:SAM-dependent methyltransferase
MKDKENIKQQIRKNYGKIAKRETQAGGCCCGGDSSCCGDEPFDISKSSFNIGYTKDDLKNAPEESNMGLGCGNPVAIAALKEGETVLDLGSGGGFDCFLARQRVGETGNVIGVDMTPDMIQLARKNAEKSGYANVDFRLGEIEHLPVADESVDVILSNCVINLSVDKKQIFRDAYRVLKPGGRLSISDVVAIQRLSEQMKKDMDLICGCIGGAEYVEDVKAMLLSVGFRDVRLIQKEDSADLIRSWGFGGNVENYVASYTIEAVK